MPIRGRRHRPKARNSPRQVCSLAPPLPRTGLQTPRTTALSMAALSYPPRMAQLSDLSRGVQRMFDSRGQLSGKRQERAQRSRSSSPPRRSFGGSPEPTVRLAMLPTVEDPQDNHGLGRDAITDHIAIAAKSGDDLAQRSTVQKPASLRKFTQGECGIGIARTAAAAGSRLLSMRKSSKRARSRFAPGVNSTRFNLDRRNALLPLVGTRPEPLPPNNARQSAGIPPSAVPLRRSRR